MGNGGPWSCAKCHSAGRCGLCILTQEEDLVGSKGTPIPQGGVSQTIRWLGLEVERCKEVLQ